MITHRVIGDIEPPGNTRAPLRALERAMKLWSGTLSPFSAKVRIVLAEKGIEAEIAEIPGHSADAGEAGGGECDHGRGRCRLIAL